MLATIAAALVAISAFIYILFVREKDIPEPIPVSPIQHLEDRKQAIYENLRDLQFEFRLGKLSDEDYKETKQALQRELAVVLAETESTLNRLGLAERDLKKFAQAETSLKRALTIRENNLPSNHPWIAVSLDNLASVYLARGEYGKAAPLIKRAQAIRSHSAG